VIPRPNRGAPARYFWDKTIILRSNRSGPALEFVNKQGEFTNSYVLRSFNEGGQDFFEKYIWKILFSIFGGIVVIDGGACDMKNI